MNINCLTLWTIMHGLICSLSVTQTRPIIHDYHYTFLLYVDFDHMGLGYNRGKEKDQVFSFKYQLRKLCDYI